jgi:Na+-driven multidrug efflux pump
METRNKYLTTKAFRIYLGASILTALSSMLGNIVDSVIVSNMISHDAMSAVSLARPLIQLYYTIYLLIGLGGSLLVAFAMGKNDRREANHTFTLVVWVLAAFSLIATVVGLWRPQWVVDMFCTNADVYSYALEYFRPVLWGCVFYIGSFFFGTYTTIDGAPKLVSLAMIVDNVCNLCFDVVLIKWLDLGTAGSAIASNIGHVVGISIMASHYLKGGSSYRLVSVKLQSVGRTLASIARSGAPFAVASICLTLYMYAANIIIQDHYGASGIYIFSVMLSLLTFYNFFLAGACNTLQSLGAILVGMGDMVGLRLSVNAAFKFLIGSLVVCCGVLWAIPGEVCRLFGCPDALLAECCYACRIYAAAFVFFCLIYLLMVNYKLLKQEALANFLSFALSLSVIPVIWIIATQAPGAIWWSNLIAYLLVFVVALAWSEIKRRDGASFLTLLPTREANPTLDFSVSYTNEGLAEAFERITEFLDRHHAKPDSAFAIKLSAEELLKNVIQHNQQKSQETSTPYIDLRLTVIANNSQATESTETSENTNASGSQSSRPPRLQGSQNSQNSQCSQPQGGAQKIILSLRDDGRPFDPTAGQHREGSYGLTLATAFNQTLTYKYMFGQNITLVEVN